MSNLEKKVILTFDTFRSIGLYEQRNLEQTQPSCFNGNVCIKKYRVTIEEIEESTDVLAERLQNLWDTCTSWHNTAYLQNVANKIGYKLKGNAGNLKK